MNPKAQSQNTFKGIPPFSWFPHPHQMNPPYFAFPPRRQMQSQKPPIIQQMQTPVKQEQGVVKIQENRMPPTVFNYDNMLQRRAQEQYQSYENQEQYWSSIFQFKRPYVIHQATYYDPSAAPMVTSDAYFSTHQYEQDQIRLNRMRQIPTKQLNQLDFPQIDDSPFIKYKHRRIKKKYKKHLNNRDLEFSNFDQVQDDSEQDLSESVNSQLQLPGINKNAMIELPRNKLKKKNRKIKSHNFEIEPAFSINLSFVVKKEV